MAARIILPLLAAIAGPLIAGCATTGQPATITYTKLSKNKSNGFVECIQKSPGAAATHKMQWRLRKYSGIVWGDLLPMGTPQTIVVPSGKTHKDYRIEFKPTVPGDIVPPQGLVRVYPGYKATLTASSK